MFLEDARFRIVNTRFLAIFNPKYRFTFMGKLLYIWKNYVRGERKKKKKTRNKQGFLTKNRVSLAVA